MAPDSTTSLSWEYIAPVDNGELIFAGTFSAKDDYYGTYDPEVYIFGPGADIIADGEEKLDLSLTCLLYTSPSPRDQRGSRMPSSA